MCGRFTLTTDLDATSLAAMFEAKDRIQELKPRYNIAPTQPAACVLMERDKRVLEYLRWGLVPAWAQDRSIASRLINARAEMIERWSVFREGFARRRCLIPSDGFYEWSGRERTPHWIRLREGAPFACAGLYEPHIERGGRTLSTFTIITTEPNELVSPLHDRMPVIIPAEHYDRWLDPTRSSKESRSLLRPYPAEEMTVTPVSRTVNRADAEGPDCILPAPTVKLSPLERNLELFAVDTYG